MTWNAIHALWLTNYTCIAVSPDSSRIAMACNARVLWHSSDAGQSWRNEPWRHEDGIRDIFFADHRRLYVLGQHRFHQIDFHNHCDVGLRARVYNGVGIKVGVSIKLLSANGSSEFSSNIRTSFPPSRASDPSVIGDTSPPNRTPAA
ncbi:MAG: hypothetical protein IH600_01550 [Bacteroidetes bacterium]|nr:hypothetical protein [Bacteroidota bacterium]